MGPNNDGKVFVQVPEDKLVNQVGGAKVMGVQMLAKN
jgi:hypothetical protein